MKQVFSTTTTTTTPAAATAAAAAAAAAITGYLPSPDTMLWTLSKFTNVMGFERLYKSQKLKIDNCTVLRELLTTTTTTTTVVLVVIRPINCQTFWQLFWRKDV